MKLIAQIEEKSNVVGRFYTEEALSIWTNICKHLYAYRSASRHIMRSVPVFIPKAHNQTNYKCLHKFVQTLKEHENFACDDSNESLYLAKKYWRKNMALDPCLNFSLYMNSKLGSTRGTPSQSVAAPTSLQSRSK